MSQSLTTYDARAIRPQPPDEMPNDSARGAVWAGWIILLVFFGGIGAWAVTAPLNGAVVGEAVVKVEGNRKSVQHPDGGVVKRLLVKEGDRVAEGDVLVVLDDTQTRAEFDILSQQNAVLRATEARLQSELAGSEAIAFPPELAASDAPFAKTAMETQRQEFESRRTALRGEEGILSRRISQLQEQIAGNEAQERAYNTQRASVLAEKESLADLVAKGLVTRPRILQLERTATGLEGQIAALRASSAAAEQSISEYSQQIAQVAKTRSAEVTKDLSDIQSKLLDVTPRLHNAEVSLRRMEVRSPYAGEVVDLKVFSVGGVIGRGEKILDVVPDRTALVVEARVRVEDISDLRPGMKAEVHFTSYKQRTIPLIHGRVSQVSADRLTDQRTGSAYYTTTIDVDKEELAASPEIELYPGMPATVMVTTKERTALDYIVGPFVASLDKSFREK